MELKLEPTGIFVNTLVYVVYSLTPPSAMGGGSEQELPRVYMCALQTLWWGASLRTSVGDHRLQLGFVTLCIASSTRNWVGSSSVCGFLDSLALTTHSLLKVQNRREWTMPSTTRGGSSDWFCSGLPCMETSSKKTMWPWLSWRYVCVCGGGHLI